MKTKTNTTFKKSVLSFLVISAVAGSFIPWEEYLPRSETPAMKAFYENSENFQGQVLSESMSSTDADLLADIAEKNLISDLDAEIDEQVLLNAQAFTEQAYSPEADEAIDNGIDELVLTEPNAQQAPESAVNHSDISPEAPQMMAEPLLFSFDSSEINPEYFQALNQTAKYIQSATTEENSVWQVVGYADLSGNRVYNRKLAQQRAQKVAAYLVDKGVQEEALSVVSLGASQPLHEARSVENNRHERRVEIHTYQAEITALVDQYNKQMQQQANHQKALQLAKRQAELEMQQYVEQLTQVTTQDSAIKSENNVEEKVAETAEQPAKQTPEKLKAEISERLTTAMEL